MLVSRRMLIQITIIAVIAIVVGAGAYFFGVSVPTWQETKLARAALENYDYVKASEHVKNHLSRFPDDANARMLAAEIARRRNEFAEAKTHLDVAAMHGDSNALSVARQLLNIQAGDLSGAERWGQRCKENPRDPESALALEAIFEGSLRAGKPDFATAAVVLWQQSRLDPVDQAQGLVWRGRLKWWLNGSFPHVLADFEQAVEMAPEHPGARLWLATALLDHEPRRAVFHLDWLRQRQGDTPEIRFLEARMHRNLGQPEKAAAILDDLLKLEPDKRSFLLERGNTALDLAQLGEAERWLLRAHAKEPDLRDVNVALTNCFRRSGQVDKANHHAEKVRAIERRLDKLQADQKAKVGS